MSDIQLACLFFHFGYLARRFSYTCNINNMHKFVQEVASTQVTRYKKRNLYPWPGTVSKMVLYATGLDSGVRGLEPRVFQEVIFH